MSSLELFGKWRAYILTRPGFTRHPLTIRAAAHMIDLVHRGEHFRPEQS